MIRKDSLLTGFSVSLGVAGALLLLFLAWRLLGAFAAMITPFVAATVLALIFDPVVDRLERGFPNTWGQRRLISVAFVFLGLLLVLAGLLAFIVPNLIAQTSRLITFFAPLTYKIERTRNDGRYIIIAKDVTGSSFVVKGLQNNHEYGFRVIATDSEGKRYDLLPTTAIPHPYIVHRELVSHVPADGGKKRRNQGKPVPTADNANDTGDLYPPDVTVLSHPTPRAATPPPITSILAPIISPTSPPPSATPTPFEEEIDDSSDNGENAANGGATPSPTATGKTSGDQNSEVDTEPFHPGSRGENGSNLGPSMTLASPVSSATPEAPRGDPAQTAEASPRPTPLVPVATGQPAFPPSPTTAPSVVPNVAMPSPGASLSPRQSTPVSTREKATPSPRVHSTPAATPGTPAPDAQSERLPEIQMPEPGAVVALPGDGQVRLLWRPPITAASGFDRLRTQVDQWLMAHRSIGPVKLPQNLSAIQAQYSAQLSEMVQQVSQRAADIVVGSVSTALTITLSLIIGFYLLVDFDRLRMRMFHLIPEQARGGVLQIVTDVGIVFGNYVRGMSTVAALYGCVSILVFFALGAFFDIGLRGYALLLGVMAGVLYPIPFLGPILTTIVVTAVALATGATPFQGVIALLTVQVQNGIFDNVVTPRIVGQSVGLHPLATIFALLLGAQLFGLAGMLLSVPIAASIQRLLIRLYPHLGEPTPMIVQNPLYKEKKREDAQTKTEEATPAVPPAT